MAVLHDVIRRVIIQDADSHFATVTDGKLDVNASVTVDNMTASTEYTEGATDATITGGVVMWEDAGDAIAAVSAAKPLPVNIVAGSASGTEYTEGATDATIAGTAILWEDAADTLVTVNASKPLPTDVSDKALRDIGKVDVASLDQYTPRDTDTGGGTENSLPVAIMFPASGGGGVCPGDATSGMKVQGPLTDTQLRASDVKVTLDSEAVVLGAGTAAFGKLVANSGVDIGDVDVTSIAAGDNNIGNVDIVTVPAPLSTTGGGTEATALRVTLATDSTGVVSVDDNGGTLTVDNGGTFAVQATLAAETTKVIGTVNVAAAQTIAVTNAGTFAAQATAVGTVADDATTPGAPVMIGGQAKETDGTDPGSVSGEDDVARCITDRNRRLLVNDRHPFAFRATLQHDTAQADHELVAAPGAGLSLYLTDVIVSNGATAGTCKIIEDTASAKTALIDVMYLAINGGAVLNLRTTMRLTANKNLGFTSATVTTHTVTVCGYTAP
jgi:hypothetical protein